MDHLRCIDHLHNMIHGRQFLFITINFSHHSSNNPKWKKKMYEYSMPPWLFIQMGLCLDFFYPKYYFVQVGYCGQTTSINMPCTMQHLWKVFCLWIITVRTGFVTIQKLRKIKKNNRIFLVAIWKMHKKWYILINIFKYANAANFKTYLFYKNTFYIIIYFKTSYRGVGILCFIFTFFHKIFHPKKVHNFSF